MLTSPLKVALVHDWLVNYRGGEKVLEQICRLFPQADIYTLFYKPGKSSSRIEKHKIYPSFLNSFPKVESYYRFLLPIFPYAIEQFDLTGYDLIISSSHCVAKGVLCAPDTPHLCYCHTPMRYVWDQRKHYFGTGLKAKLLSPFLHYLRIWDESSAQRPDHYLANSNWVNKRIEKYYRISASVVHPPVEDYFLQAKPQIPEDYYLIVSAFAPYKRLDIALEACLKTKRKLYVVGDGQNDKALRKYACDHIQFLGKVSQSQLRDLYSKAKAFLFPGEEDFGITPLESMACARPVIAYGRGGVTETLLDQKTGLFFYEQNWQSLAKCLDDFEKIQNQFDPAVCQSRAKEFSQQVFLENFTQKIVGLNIKSTRFHGTGFGILPLNQT